MTDIEATKLVAWQNVLASLDTAAHFPQRIFSGVWANFLFFESDHMFSPSFAKIVSGLMQMEQAKCCCLLNITQTRDVEYKNAATIFLTNLISTTEYDLMIRAGGPARGWLFNVDRYGCASNRGEWCIYCEKENDIAVIGLRSANGLTKFASTLRELHADSIERLVQYNSVAPFPFSRLTAEWRSALVKQYAQKSRKIGR